MRRTPSAKATVTTAGKPSGTAATARLIDVINNSSGGVPRINPNPKSSITIPRAAQTNTRPKASSFFSSGVCLSVPASSISSAMCPNSVLIAVATMTAFPVPVATLVPMNTMFSRSPSGTSCASSVVGRLVTGCDSPVSGASMQRSIAADRIRPSAATKSPDSSSMTSPTTISVAGIKFTFPSRITFA